MTASSVLFDLILVSEFWSAYTFLFYPAALPLLPRFRHSPQPPPARHACPDELPRVALVISAYNEQAVIRAKLENSISIDYPAAQLGIWVSSDGSSDATCPIVREFARAHARVRLLAHAVHRGKT